MKKKKKPPPTPEKKNEVNWIHVSDEKEKAQ
jgi:hypothetical protein